MKLTQEQVDRMIEDEHQKNCKHKDFFIYGLHGDHLLLQCKECKLVYLSKDKTISIERNESEEL